MARFWGILLFAVAFACLLMAGHAEARTRLTVPHILPGDNRHDYIISLLKLALDKTVDEYGDYELVHCPYPAEQKRNFRLVLNNGGLDLLWSMTTRHREKVLLPIRIPLQKGLLGHRIFLIRPEMQETFSKVDSLLELKYLTAGQGHDWPDNEILKYNGLRVVSCHKYPLCFSMLEKGRFDYFPRGLAEPLGELRQYAHLGLVIENTILLRYPAPIYFFVNRGNPALAERLEKGLRTAIDDGSFDNLFYNHPQIREIFERFDLKSHKIIDLVNPQLPPETPIGDKSLWINLEKIPSPAPGQVMTP